MGQAVTRHYRVEGMVCAACQATVERAAMRLAQVSSARASASEGTLEVTYAGGADVDVAEGMLGQAIHDSGYELVGESGGGGAASRRIYHACWDFTSCGIRRTCWGLTTCSIRRARQGVTAR